MESHAVFFPEICYGPETEQEDVKPIFLPEFKVNDGVNHVSDMNQSITERAIENMELLIKTEQDIEEYDPNPDFVEPQYVYIKKSPSHFENSDEIINDDFTGKSEQSEDSQDYTQSGDFLYTDNNLEVEQETKLQERKTRKNARKKEKIEKESEAARLERLERDKIRVRLSRDRRRERLLEIQNLIRQIEEEVNYNELVNSGNERLNESELHKFEVLRALKLEEAAILEKKKHFAAKVNERRLKESPEKRAERLEKARIRTRERRDRESEEQKRLRRDLCARKVAEVRRNLPQEEKEFRKVRDREYMRRKRQMETPEQREKRISKDRERARNRRLLQKMAQEINKLHQDQEDFLQFANFHQENLSLPQAESKIENSV